MTRVKICGITSLADALAACDAGADALGFNFAPEARQRNRYIDPDEARRVIGQLPPFVTSVAVCVNEPLDRLRGHLAFVDCLQLHGEETPEVCAEVAPRCVKAFCAGAGFEPNAMLAYPASAYLLDASVPGARGGTGCVCDWQAARAAVELGKPIVLAGGLTPSNVAEAVGTVRPWAVDVAGGVEREPGRKDPVLMREFVQNAKLPLP